MGIAVSIVSAVLKSVVGNNLGSGLFNKLADIVIDEVSEKSINEITGFINGEKSKIDNILSKENLRSIGILEDNIDYIVAEIKDFFSEIDITDEVFRQCKYGNTNLKVFLWNKYCKCKNEYIECENEIKQCLYVVAGALINLVRESKEFEKDVLIYISNSVDNTNAGLKKISNYMKDNFDKLDNNGQIMLNILLAILEQIQKMNMQDNKDKSILDEGKKFKKNRKEDYIRSWNSKLFLQLCNNDNPLNLADTFIVPDYEIHTHIKKVHNCSENRHFEYCNDDTLTDFIHKFMTYNQSLTMLISGVPGSGKSSVISWIADEYKDDERIIILRFRDWKRIVLEKTLLYAICTKLECEEEDLEDIILILDGFDEIKALDIREDLLNSFLTDIKDLKNFKCIITSRPTYINSEYFHYTVVLKKFDIEKVSTFYRKITGKRLDKKEKIESNLEVLGIPVILYMSIMAEIDISEKHTEPELYSCIFAEEGGIFDKFSYKGTGYDVGNQILRDPKNIKKYLSFLKKVAYTMFEKNNLLLLKKEYEIPKLEFQGKNINILEFPIKYLFEHSCQNIEFIHKSIYEYFVAEYFFSSMDKVIAKDQSPKKLARILGRSLIKNSLSPEVLAFLKYKIQNSKLNDAFDVVNKTFQLMMRNGMTYYLNKQYKNTIKCEMNIFRNMLEIIHLWEKDYYVCDTSIYTYLRFGEQYLNLKYLKINQSKEVSRNKRVDLSGANLCNAYLNGSDLSNMNLYKADLSGAKLEGANLRNADLRKASLRGSDLKGANLELSNLRNADLEDADLSGSILNKTNFRETNLKEAKFYKANLVEAFFRESNLKGAILEGANLSKADFIETNLEQTNLEATNLTGTIFDDNQVEYLRKRYELYNVKVFNRKSTELQNYLDY